MAISLNSNIGITKNGITSIISGKICIPKYCLNKKFTPYYISFLFAVRVFHPI